MLKEEPRRRRAGVLFCERATLRPVLRGHGLLDERQQFLVDR